jgi:alkyldihydroxyacetonephosphate synthase
VNEPAQDTKWWGWGPAERQPELSPQALAVLEAEVGATQDTPPVDLEQVRLPAPRPLPEPVRRAVGEDAVLTGDEDRVRHAAAQSYPDLIRLRLGELPDAPDAVLMPADAEEVARVLAACTDEGVAVVPFGGGTSVVGGVDPHRGGLEALVSLDLARMRDVEVDRRSLTARLGPGLRGPEAEAALNAAGVTLGHFPQSFEYATIGGFAATRSAGQASTGYGRFDALVTSARLTAPAGELRTLETPHSAAGPALRELILGSEGALGVITEVGVRVRPSPGSRRHEAWMAADFESGLEIVRSLAQQGVAPDIVRLSDREETRMSLAMSASDGLARRAFEAYLRLRGRSDGCILIYGWHGDRESVARRRTLAARVTRDGSGAYLGRAPGEAWRRGRFEGPFLRETLLDHGLFVETLETSHTWSRLGELYGAVGGALRSSLDAQGTPGIVLCHVSHLYPDGASLYFTWIARRRFGEEIEQWRAVKTAACDAIVATQGTITHHHAVGRDHVPYMEAEIGDLGLDVLRAVKRRLDPAGIMNPGKLLG